MAFLEMNGIRIQCSDETVYEMDSDTDMDIKESISDTRKYK